MFPTAKSKLIGRIDRERRSLELQGIRTAYRFGTVAWHHAYPAIEPDAIQAVAIEAVAIEVA